MIRRPGSRKRWCAIGSDSLDCRPRAEPGHLHFFRNKSRHDPIGPRYHRASVRRLPRHKFANRKRVSSWAKRNPQSASTNLRMRRTIHLRKRSGGPVRPRGNARWRENPLEHRAATLRIRAVLLTFYRNKKLNKLTQLTQPLPSRYFTSLSSGLKRDPLCRKTKPYRFRPRTVPGLKLVTVYSIFGCCQAATGSVGAKYL